jgi:hypothetical protein
MAFIPVPSLCSEPVPFRSKSHRRFATHRAKIQWTKTAPLAIAATLALLLVTPLALRAQAASAEISTVTPNIGKADDSITIVGKNLGKKVVTAVYLSDAKLDHKAVVVDQEPTKIVIKVPALKPGDYNISIEESGSIYIQPLIFKVKT